MVVIGPAVFSLDYPNAVIFIDLHIEEPPVHLLSQPSYSQILSVLSPDGNFTYTS